MKRAITERMPGSRVSSVRFSVETTAERFLPGRMAQRGQPFFSHLDTMLFAKDERGQAGCMSLNAFAFRIASAVIAFVSQVPLARWMGSFQYGIFVLVWLTAIIFGNLVCLGFHTSVMRFGLRGTAIATASAMIFDAFALSFAVWRRLGIVMAVFLPVRAAKEAF
jgi:hypothetical protein